MKIYIGILSITLCILQVSGGKPKHGKHHSHGSPSENDIYATVSPRHGGRGGGHGHGHHHGGPSNNPNDIIYADIQHGPPDQDPIYANVGGGGGRHHHHHHQPSENDPETLYSPVNGPAHGGRHGGGGGGYGGGGWGGGNQIGDPDDDNEPVMDHLPFQTRPHGAPPLPPRPPGGHPNPHSHHGPHHPGHDHGNGLQRRGACRR